MGEFKFIQNYRKTRYPHLNSITNQNNYVNRTHYRFVFLNFLNQNFNMLLFTTKAHGILDYIMGFFFLLVPTFLRLNFNSAEGFILYVVGAFLLSYSALTNYEMGLIKLISVKMHLTLDIFSGIFLAVVPWVINIEAQARIPFVILGVIQIVAGVTTASEVAIPNPPIEKLLSKPRRTTHFRKNKNTENNEVVEANQVIATVDKRTFIPKTTTSNRYRNAVES